MDGKRYKRVELFNPYIRSLNGRNIYVKLLGNQNDDQNTIFMEGILMHTSEQRSKLQW